MSYKTERIASSLVKEISEIIAEEVRDENIKFVTITSVDLASDLSYAKVYWTTLLDNKKELTATSLKNASSYIKGMLYDRVELRTIPNLQFIYDDSIAYGNKIEKIIEKINNEEN